MNKNIKIGGRLISIFVPPLLGLFVFGPFIVFVQSDPLHGKILRWIDTLNGESVIYNCFEPDKPLEVDSSSQADKRVNLQKVLSQHPIIESLPIPLTYFKRQICLTDESHFEYEKDSNIGGFIDQIVFDLQRPLSKVPFCTPLLETSDGIVLPDVVYKNTCLYYVKDKKKIIDENPGELIMHGEIKPIRSELSLVVFGGLIVVWWGLLLLAKNIKNYILNGFKKT